MLVSHVPVQIPALSGTIRTVRTREGFLANVQPNVGPQMGRVRTYVVADTTEQHILFRCRPVALPNSSCARSPPRDALRRKQK